MKFKQAWAGVAALGALAGLAAACGGKQPLDVSSGSVLQNVAVVNTHDGSVAVGMNVIVDQGRIVRVTGEPLRLSGSARAIDASGKYVVPGYLDMHTHVLDTGDGQASTWPLLIANGITGVRQMSGSAQIVQLAHQLNADSAAGKIAAPEILMAPAGIFGGQASTDADARKMVQAYKEAGAGFLKVVNGNREAVLALLDEGKKYNLLVSGHLPFTVPAAELSAKGWRAIEHQGGAFGMLLDCAGDETAIRQALLAAPPNALGPFGAINPRLYDANAFESAYRGIQASFSEQKCNALADTFAHNSTWQVPTLIRVRTSAFGADSTYRNDPNLVYVSKTTRAVWEQVAQAFLANVRPSAAAVVQGFYPLQQRANAIMQQRGVKIMTGTDIGGAWLIPGFSLHQEFRELAAAGMTPLNVLQAATLNGAEFLGRVDMGSVEAGKRADLVLLDGNPLDSVANLGRIAGVVLAGRYYDAAALAKMKGDVAQAFAAQPLQALATVLDAQHKH